MLKIGNYVDNFDKYYKIYKITNIISIIVNMGLSIYLLYEFLVKGNNSGKLLYNLFGL